VGGEGIETRNPGRKRVYFLIIKKLKKAGGGKKIYMGEHLVTKTELNRKKSSAYFHLKGTI